MSYPVWFDCDVGIDDAIALMCAHALPEISILGISTVSGNVEVSKTFQNAHKICGVMHADYPIYRGAEKPLLRELNNAADIHGANGLGGVELPMPEHAVIHEKPAWDALYEAAQAQKGALRLIAVGPLTNVAIAVKKYPDLPALLHTILIMGGSASVGNVTPCAEFNIYADPEAAEVVFGCGAPVVMCGLDVTNKATLQQEDLDALAASGTACGKVANAILSPYWKILQSYGYKGIAMHDSCPVFYLAHPELFSAKPAGVVVETESPLTFGKTVTDLYSDKKFPQKNATVVLDVDRDKMITMLKKAVTSI